MQLSHAFREESLQFNEDFDKRFDLQFLEVLTKIHSGVKYIAGAIGVVLMSIPLIFIMPFILLSLSLGNRSLKRQMNHVYNWMNSASQNEIMNVHLMVERQVIRLKNRKRNGKIFDSNVFSMGVSSQINKMIQQLIDMEESLKKAAYPDLKKTLSKEDLLYLENEFKDLEDWNDPQLDIYEKTYL